MAFSFLGLSAIVSGTLWFAGASPRRSQPRGTMRLSITTMGCGAAMTTAANATAVNTSIRSHFPLARMMERMY